MDIVDGLQQAVDSYYSQGVRFVTVLVESPYGNGPATSLDCKQYAAENGFGKPDSKVIFALDPTGKAGAYYNHTGNSVSVVTNRFTEIVHKEVFDKPAIIYWHIEYELDLMFDALEAEAQSGK